METEPADTLPAQDVAIDRVLVPLDGLPEAETALDTATAVATRLDVPLTLFCWHWGIGAEQVGRTYLERVRTTRHLDCEIESAWSDEAGAAGPVLAEVHRVPGTLVCMASHARSGIGAVLNGSCTEGLLRRHESLLLVGPEAAARPPQLDRPVVVTVDGSSFSESAIRSPLPGPSASELPWSW